MTEQQLDGAQIGSGFQQMHRERVAQCVRGDRLADAAPPRDLPAGQIDGERMDRLTWRSAREQPLPRMGAPPIVPQHIKQRGWQHDLAVFPTLALFNPDDHALAVDHGRRQADGFGNSQTGRVTDGQHHAVLQVIHGTQETRHFFLAQHDGQLLGLMASGDVVLDDPGPFEGDGIEELAMLRHPWVFSMLQGVGCGTQCHGINSSMRFCGQPLMRRVSKSVK
jgi:hypothetical protein